MDRSIATLGVPGNGPFSQMYRDGMDLLERVSAYLGGQGRLDAAQLPEDANTAYHAESRALTTLLLQIAAWLLMERAVAEGEISMDVVRLQASRTDLKAPPAVPSPGHPDGLRTLRAEAEALRDAVCARAEYLLAAASANAERPAPAGRPHLHLVRDTLD